MAFINVGNLISGQPPIAPPKDITSYEVNANKTIAAGDAVIFSGGKLEPAVAGSTAIAGIAIEGGSAGSFIRIALNAPGQIYKCPVDGSTSGVGARALKIKTTIMGVDLDSSDGGGVNVLRIEGDWAWVTLSSNWT